ncbi:hypothetical protein LCGC14_2304220 [marine sediment metagenome]|uniref:Uncharacterized protein n=1 Tax=marine sediment metagenome TaxID=412755 RepID=A0A0F9FHH7_9ZZZZ
MSLLPEIVVEAFKDLTTQELRDLHSTEVVTKNGDYIGTFIVPQSDYVKMQVEYLGQMSNSVKPVEEAEAEPEDPDAWVKALRAPNPGEFLCSKCKAIHRRSDTTKNGKHAKDHEWVAPEPPAEETE